MREAEPVDLTRNGEGEGTVLVALVLDVGPAEQVAARAAGEFEGGGV